MAGSAYVSVRVFAIQATGVPLTRAGLLASAGSNAGTVSFEPVNGHRHAPPPRTQCVHHAIMLAVMAWMIVPVRAMSGMPAMPSRSGIADVIGTYCFLSALAWFVAGFANRPVAVRRSVAINASHAAMTAAMGITLFLSH